MAISLYELDNYDKSGIMAIHITQESDMHTLSPSQKDSLKQTFESDGYTVVFDENGMTVSKNGISTIYTNKELLGNFKGIHPVADTRSGEASPNKSNNG